MAASRLDYYVYKHYAIMVPHCNSSSTKLRYSHLLIATIDFDCTNHVDTVDEVNSAKAPIIEDLNSVISSEYVTGSHRDSAVNAKKLWNALTHLCLLCVVIKLCLLLRNLILSNSSVFHSWDSAIG